MAYLTNAKKAAIKERVKATDARDFEFLVDELQDMEAAILDGSALDFAEQADLAAIGTAAVAGTSNEAARGDHVHALGTAVLGLVADISDVGKAKAAGTSGLVARADHAHALTAGLFFYSVFAGAAAAGPCTLTGAKVGDIPILILNLTDAISGAGVFESAITVEDQIQQTSASNLSAKAFGILLLKKG